MGLKELIAQKYDQELKVLESAVKDKEKNLADIKDKLKKYCELEGKYTYFVERNDGERVSVQKKGDKVLFFSYAGRDITPRFENRKGAHRDLIEQAKALSEQDFIVDCIAIDKGDQEFCFYVSDILLLGEDVRHLPLEERKKLVKKLTYSDDFKESPSVKVSEPNDLEAAISLFEKLGSEKVVAKRICGVYSLGLSDDFISFEGIKDGEERNKP